MREIKFRAWDKNKNRMIKEVWSLRFGELAGGHDSEPEEIMGDDGMRTNNYILQQYTGIKDKNGKEIYEGDIVEISGARKGAVYYDQMYARFGFTLNRFLKGSIDLPSGDYSFYDFSSWDIQVVGNIMEH